ncbi:MAG: hypothetical protein SFU99_03945 [Saprospiraceae bacterium]|nr:hypothetical protein [Saprospiraceae bacterium]
MDKNAEKQVADENELAANSNIDDVVNEVVSDVAEPSPVMENETLSEGRTESEPAVVSMPRQENAVKGKRGRKPLPRDASGKIVRDPSQRPKLEGLKQSATQSQAAPLDPGIEPAAEVATMLINTSGMMLAGEEGAMLPQEQMLAKSGFVAYFKAKGIDNVPPWVLLTGALTPYYMRLLTQTPAKSTVATACRRAWFGIKEFFIKRKNARSNHRHNHERENNAGTENGSASS